jgi:hypothetical protein
VSFCDAESGPGEGVINAVSGPNLGFCSSRGPVAGLRISGSGRIVGKCDSVSGPIGGFCNSVLGLISSFVTQYQFQMCVFVRLLVHVMKGLNAPSGFTVF